MFIKDDAIKGRLITINSVKKQPVEQHNSKTVTLHRYDLCLSPAAGSVLEAVHS